MSNRPITVRSLKYDGRLHREWRAQIVQLDEPLIVVAGEFESEVSHPFLGTILAGTRSEEYFWTDRWYSVFRFTRPTGELINYYCNVNTPVRLEYPVLSFVDLDMDVLVAPDFSSLVLDEDEFEENEKLLSYPPEYRRRALEALAELETLISLRRFPFGPEAT